MTIKPIIKKLKKDEWNHDDIKAMLSQIINKIDTALPNEIMKCETQSIF